MTRGRVEVGTGPWHAWPGLWPVAIAAVLLLVATQGAGAYEHVRHTPSVGVQLHMGWLWYDSAWADVFGQGGGGAVRVRQYVSRNQAIGFSFEQQKFKRYASVPEDNPYSINTHLQMQVYLFDYFFYFNRPAKRSRYLVLSGGFYRPELIREAHSASGTTSFDVAYPSEGFAARVGYGLEYFLKRNFSLDGSVSLYYLRTPHMDGLTFSGMGALGIHLYAGK